jgi:hypothetical protein
LQRTGRIATSMRKDLISILMSYRISLEQNAGTE